jgi:hypothetical protein
MRASADAVSLPPAQPSKLRTGLTIVDDQPTGRGRRLLATPGQAVRRRHADLLARATVVAGVGAAIVSLLSAPLACCWLCCSCCDRASSRQTVAMRTRPTPIARSAFAGFCFPPDVIVLAVRWYLRFALSYRDVEELLAERGIHVDRVTIYRWVQRFKPLLPPRSERRPTCWSVWISARAPASSLLLE